MNTPLTTETVKELLAPLLEKGFVFTYKNEKGGDSSCSYISRFQKGRDFFDWREISGSNDVHFVVYVKDGYLFPSLKNYFPKQMKKFAAKHFFKRATLAEKRTFYASLLLEYLAAHDDFFGIPIKE